MGDSTSVQLHKLVGLALAARPDATAETIVDGWLRTGDIGHLDDEGLVYVDDRLKDMVLRGGENVYCAEVEAAIYEHPAVMEAAVLGVPHERLGEEVATVIVLNSGASLTKDELVEALQKASERETRKARED